MSDQSISEIAIGLVKLQSLILYRCSNITNKGVCEISVKLIDIRTLILSGCKITNKGASEISNIRKLQTLDLSRCFITDEGVGYIATKLDNLQTLKLSGYKITNDCIKKIPKTIFTNLRT